MNKIKIFMITLVIIIMSGLFCTSYGAMRSSTKSDPKYAEMWNTLYEYAEGVSSFNPATCEVTDAMKWIEWFEVQDFERDELELYRKECIKILGLLKTNQKIYSASNKQTLMRKITEIDQYATDTWSLSEDEKKTLGLEQAEKNKESLEIINEKEKDNEPKTEITPKPINKGKEEKTVTSINPTDYMPSASPDNADKLADIGNTIIGVVQIIGSIVSVAVLAILGIKYMIGSAEERAEYKKSMRPYIIGAVMVFSITNILVIILKIARGLF